jgi:hypothetical protein
LHVFPENRSSGLVLLRVVSIEMTALAIHSRRTGEHL